jgi:hypothetical protein
MLDHCTPTHFEAQNRTLLLVCQALAGGGHVLELPASEIPALEVRIVAGVGHNRPDPTRGVQTSIAQSASYVDRAVGARRISALHRATKHRADYDKGPADTGHQPHARMNRYQHGQ